MLTQWSLWWFEVLLTIGWLWNGFHWSFSSNSTLRHLKSIDANFSLTRLHTETCSKPWNQFKMTVLEMDQLILGISDGKHLLLGWSDTNSDPLISRSNCDPTVTRILRQYYQRPHFLPKDSEDSRLDWIFMGTPGYGAPMHVSSNSLISFEAFQKSSYHLSSCRSTKLAILLGRLK